ncbi:hypothetical protein [Segatella buccae]|uniref:hypothetical protein n=1 Tax=Segatella buccae TaxID=28126 RepID=UPI0028ECF651|nr:hypothetical protein [Segatella buccae]
MKRKLRFSILMLLMAVCGAANVQAENVTFTFNTDEGLKTLGITKPKTGKGTNLNTKKPYKLGEVSMKVEKGTASISPRVWNKKNTLDLRIYDGSSLTFSVPEGYVITEVKMEGTKIDNLSNLNNDSWKKGEENEISFTANDTQNINTITVTYKKKTPAPTSVSVTIGKTGYATLYYSSLALTVPAGVKGYTCSLAGGSFKMEEVFTEGKIIPAGTGVLLNGNPGIYTFNVSSEAGTFGADNNWLKGSDEEAMTEGGERYYMLSLDANNTEGSVGFYWGVANGEAFKNGAHKAYLCVKDNATGAKTCYRFDGQTTAIDGTRANKPTAADGAVYDLAGQRVDRSYKGVVIKNGKKYIQ